MNFRQLLRALETIKKLESVLEEDHEYLLDQAIAELQNTKKQYDRYQKRSDLKTKPVNDWGYSILHIPLRFKMANYKGYQLRPDIICNFRWQKEGALPTTQELVLRVWSADEKIMYRESYDSEVIGELVTAQFNPLKERVIYRLHFDLANPTQSGPKYHFQIGGNPVNGEYLWFPKELDLPRLSYPPMDLILLSQLVVANFFPDEYRTLRQDASWHWAVTMMESYLLDEYYSFCLQAIRSRHTTLIDELWNR